MSPHQVTAPVAIIAMKTVTLILGGLITYLSYKAYRRTGAEPLRYLSVGFGIVTLGSLLAGVIDQILQAGFRFGLLVESTLVALGFAVIVYSLYSN
jgi:hypothetical protein